MHHNVHVAAKRTTFASHPECPLDVDTGPNWDHLDRGQWMCPDSLQERRLSKSDSDEQSLMQRTFTWIASSCLHLLQVVDYPIRFSSILLLFFDDVLVRQSPQLLGEHCFLPSIWHQIQFSFYLRFSFGPYFRSSDDDSPVFTSADRDLCLGRDWL